jgi:CheY-like chemotaxis protein
VPRPNVSTEIGEARPVVLVADDDADNRAIFTAILDHPGFRAIAASGGREAIEIARRECPRFIVMDLMMPDVGGDEALRNMRADPACPYVPALAVTAQTLYSPRRARADGFCGVVHKPVSPRHPADAFSGASRTRTADSDGRTCPVTLRRSSRVLTSPTFPRPASYRRPAQRTCRGTGESGSRCTPAESRVQGDSAAAVPCARSAAHCVEPGAADRWDPTGTSVCVRTSPGPVPAL